MTTLADMLVSEPPLSEALETDGHCSEFREAAKIATQKIEARFASRLEINRDLTRSLVSFQANKQEAVYKWFKYREGFSKPLIAYIIQHSGVGRGAGLLDPFAGTGAACFVANELGLKATAIELLPVGSYFIAIRTALRSVDAGQISKWITHVLSERPWASYPQQLPFNHIAITNGAFPAGTEEQLGRYRAWVQSQEGAAKSFYDLLAYSILEDISYTRKDGQYLRWDHRCSRTKLGGGFDKGRIWTFDEALTAKCHQIQDDLDGVGGSVQFNFGTEDPVEDFNLFTGSNFDAMSTCIQPSSMDLIVTSPPYCNRYDYTRTYALELAYLECSETDVRALRQALLSCTVENKPKELAAVVNSDILAAATKAFEENDALQSVLNFLRDESEQGRLNNKGILRMVRGYFLEMAVHIFQCAPVMKAGGRVYMVNDNVRYNGVSIPVDCILSDFAECAGFECERIWVLPVGKGNSSQQMKLHGRSELRKCIYVWRKL